MAVTLAFATPPVAQPTMQVPGTKVQVVQVQYTGTYATGGVPALTAANLGVNSLAGVQAVIAQSVSSSTGASAGVNALWNPVSASIELFGGAAAGAIPAEITAGTTVTGLKVNLLVFSA